MYKNKGSKTRFQKLILIWPGILVLLGLIVYPLGSILLQSVFPQLFDSGFTKLSFASFVTVFSTTYTYKSILNALLYGGGSAILASLIGTFLAVLVYRKWVHGQKLINVLVWIVFFTPTYLVAQGWVLMMQHKGVLSEILHLQDGSLDWFFTPAGLIFAMAARLFPVVYLSVMAGLRGLGSDFEDAARTLGSNSIRIWVKINIPLLYPAILAGATLAFAESVSDFGFASAMVPKSHIPLLTYSIYVAMNQMPIDYAQVGALSIVLIGVIALALWIQKRILGKGSYSIIQNQIRPFRNMRPPTVRWTLAAYGVIFVTFIVPLLGMLTTSFMDSIAGGISKSNFTLKHYASALQVGGDSFEAIIRSIELAFATALVSTLLGIGLAFIISRVKGISTQFLYVLTMSTLAIPGLVLAVGFVFAWNAPYLGNLNITLYGTMFCLYLAYVAGSLPNSIRLQIAAITQISPSMLYAAQVHGANLFVVFRKIMLPLISVTTISTFFLLFSHTMFELPSSELLYPPGEPVLPVVITHSYNEFKDEDGAALTVLSIALVLAFYGIGQLLIQGWQKVRRVIANKQLSGVNGFSKQPIQELYHLNTVRTVETKK